MFVSLFLCFFVSLFLCGDITSCSVNGIIQQPKTPHKMKKFILSAALALACFTAQAKNEVIKNDDDKNPKNKAKVAKAEVTQLADVGCTVYGSIGGMCGDEWVSVGTSAYADSCWLAAATLRIKLRFLTLC